MASVSFRTCASETSRWNAVRSTLSMGSTAKRSACPPGARGRPRRRRPRPPRPAAGLDLRRRVGGRRSRGRARSEQAHALASARSSVLRQGALLRGHADHSDRGDALKGFEGRFRPRHHAVVRLRRHLWVPVDPGRGGLIGLADQLRMLPHILHDLDDDTVPIISAAARPRTRRGRVAKKVRSEPRELSRPSLGGARGDCAARSGAPVADRCRDHPRGRGRPRKGAEKGRSIPSSIRCPVPAWTRREERAEAEGVSLQAALRAAVLKRTGKWFRGDDRNGRGSIAMNAKS